MQILQDLPITKELLDAVEVGDLDDIKSAIAGGANIHYIVKYIELGGKIIDKIR